MNRTWIVLLALAALGLIGLGHGYLLEDAAKKEAPPVRAASIENEDPRVAGVLNAYLPGVTHPDPAQRRAALIGLTRGLLGPGRKQIPIKPGTQEKLAQVLVRAYGQASDDSLPSVESKKLILRLICARTNTPLSKRFVISVLLSDPQELRVEALNSLGSPQGLRGEDLTRRLAELTRGGSLGSALPRALVVVKGRKARPELLEIVKTASDSETFKNAAVELQRFKDVEAMSAAVGRLKGLGFTDLDGDLDWLDGKMLARVLERAQGDEVLTALEVVAAEPSYTKECLAGIRLHIDDESPKVRALAAGLVGAAVLTENFEPHAAERLLMARLEREQDPQVLEEMNADLARVKEEREALEAGVPQK